MKKHMKLIYIFITFLLSFAFIDCGTPDLEAYPYDPVKAGATIVNSFNITNKIKFEKPSREYLISNGYNLAIYEDKIYINSLIDVIYVFDKESFIKIDEINLIYDDGDDYEKDRLRSPGTGLIIIDEEHGYLFGSISLERTSLGILFLIDLKTGETEHMGNYGEAGITLNEIRTIGYDRKNKHIWLTDKNLYDIRDGYIYFFQYDHINRVFLDDYKIDVINTKMNRGKCVFIEGDNFFYTGYYTTHDDEGRVSNIGIERYSISDPTKRQHYINTQYLNTKTIPRNILFDDPYIWIMVERDNQIQMLKLLEYP